MAQWHEPLDTITDVAQYTATTTISLYKKDTIFFTWEIKQG